MGPGGGGAAFSGGVSNLGNTMGQTGLTGTQLVFAGIGNVTLSQLTDLNGGTISISAGTAAGAAFSLGVSGGNTSGDTGVTGSRVVLAGGNGITLSQATDANGGTITVSGVTQSIQTQDRFDLSLSGNTAGVLQLVSSGTLTLAGGANITLSQNGNAVSIIGGAGGPGGTQTAISGIANSQTTYTSGTVSLSELGAITIRSTTGNQFQFSVNSQSVQPETQTFIGGLAASNTTYTSGTVTIVGSGNITVASTTGQRIIISGSQSVQPETKTFIGGLAASNTTYTSGTVTVTGVGGGVTVSSNTGQRIDISVAAPVAQTVQTQNLHNVTLSGNTSGVMAQISSGTLTLAGGNNVTLSQAGNAVTISAAAQTAQTGISSIVASDATYTSGSVQFTGSGIVTVRSSANQRVVIDASQSAQTQNLHNVTLSGNTAGVMAQISSGTMTLAGGNNITVSQAGNAITISGANLGGAQTGISGIAASNTTYTSGSVTITGVGGGVTVSSNTGQRVDISVAAPVAQTNQAGSVYAVGNTTSSSSGTYDARTMSLRGDGIISIAATNSGFRISATQSNDAGSLFAVGNTTSSSSGTYDVRTLSLRGDGIISIAATNSGFRISATESVQTQNLHNVTLSGNTSGVMAQVSSGTMTLAGGNNITLSQAGNAITISGANVGGAQTGISSIVASDATYTSGSVQFTGSGIVTIRSSANQRVVVDASQSVQPETQTFLGGIAASDTTYTSGTVRITGVGGGVTVSSNTGQRVDISVAAQSVQTQNMVAVTLSGNTSGVQALISSGTLSLAGGNNITVSQAGNAVTISGANVGGAQTGISGIANSQTTYTSGTVSMSELGAITIRSTTGNQYQFSVNAQSVQPETQTFVGGLANSQTTYTSGTISLSELGAITIRSTTGNQFQLSVNSQTVQTQSLFSAGVSTGGNTAGDTGITGTRMVFVGTNNITLSQATAAAGGTITISGPTTAAQTNQSGGAYAVGNTYSSSSGTFDARTISIRGDGIISVAATNSGWRISASQSVQPETQTFVGGIAASNTTYTSGTITITGVGGGVTVSSNTGQRVDISVAAQSVQPGVQHFVVSNTTFSSGTVSISGFGDVTVNTAANMIRISAPVQTAQTGISGLANSQTTYTSGTVSLSELGAITIRSTTGNQFQLSVNAQTTQTQNLHNVTLSGNTAGVMAQISSGTMTLAGGNNITLSQAGNAVTISGGAGGAFSAGVSTGGNTAGDTGVTGSRLVFVGTNNITLSQATAAAGGTVTISGPTQTNDSGGVYAVGNTYSTSSGSFDVRSLSIRGDGIISVAASNSGWRISASQSVQPETQTFIGGLAASNTTYTSGTVTITGVGGGVTVSSNTGQRIDISVAAPVAQTNQAGSVYAVGNTYSSSSGTYDARTVSLRGDGIISIAATDSGFRISASQSVQTQSLFSAGLSNLGNTLGDTGITGTRLVLVGTDNITLSQSTDAGGATIRISGQSPAGGAFSAGVSTGGNTAGATGISGSQMVLVGSGLVSLSQTTGANGNTVSILAPASSLLSAVSPLSTSTNGSTISLLAPAQFSGGISGGNTSGDTGTVTGRIVFAGGNNITLSGSTNAGSQTITISAGAGGAATAISGIAASNTTYTSGTVTITGVGGGVTVSSNTGQRIDISVAAQSTQPGVQHFVVSNTTFSSGTVSISGFGDVTVNTAANLIRISAPVQTAQTGISGLANSQTTYTSGTVSLSELGAITIRSTTGNQYQFSVNSQTLQTSNVHNVTLSGNTAGAMAQISSGTMTLAGGNGITLSQAGNAVTISGGAGGGFSAGVSTGGNTQGQTGVTGSRLVIVGTNNITLSQATDANGGTISISGQSPAGGAFSAGASNLGNTAGATGISGSQMVLVGSGAMSLSQTTGANGNTVSILAPAQSVLSAVAPLSTSTNGSTISFLGPATSSLAGVSGVSVSTNGSTISIFETSGGLFAQEFNPYSAAPQTNAAQGQGILHIQPMEINPDLRMDRVLLGQWISNASNSSGSITITQAVGIYSRTASTLSLITSVSTSLNFTGSGTVSSYSSYGGRRWMSIPLTTTLSQGDYYMAIMHRTTTGGAAGHTVQQIVLTQQSNATFSGWSGLLGAATNATMQHILGMGTYSASTATPPNSIGFTQIQGTGTLVMMPPIYALRSGTV